MSIIICGKSSTQQRQYTIMYIISVLNFEYGVMTHFNI